MAISLLPDRDKNRNTMMDTFLSGSGDKSYVSGTPAEFKNPLDMAKQGLAKFDKFAGITPAEPYERGRGDYRPSYQSPTLPGAGDPLQLGTKVNAQPEQVLPYNQQQAPATQPDNVMPGGVEVQAPTRPNNIMPGGVEVQAPTRPYDQAPTQISPGGTTGGDYVTDAQMKESGRFGDAQQVHQKRLEDIARLEQANAEKYGTGAKMASMGQTGSNLPDGPTADFGTKEWFKQAHAIKQGTAGRALDVREQEMGQKGELARQKLTQDQALAAQKNKSDQAIAAGKAGQQEFTNQLATDKFGFEQSKYSQEQANKSAQFDAKLENQLGSIISDPKFRQMSTQIEGTKDPAQRAQLMANFQKITGLPYDTVTNFLQKKTDPNSDALGKLLPNIN